MKIFISVDLGGTCGAISAESWNYKDDELKKQIAIMNKELMTVIDTINSFEGSHEIVVKDAFGDGLNIDINMLPANAVLVRGWDSGPLGMMQGINNTFDKTFLFGYTREAYNRATSLEGRIKRNIRKMTINGLVASEFLVSYYTSLYFGVPVSFLSGDKKLCDSIEDLDLGIRTVYTKERMGTSVQSDTPEFVNSLIAKEVSRAMAKEDDKIIIPESFSLEITYGNEAQAYRASCYPGVFMQDERTIKFVSKDFLEVLRALMFI